MSVVEFGPRGRGVGRNRSRLGANRAAATDDATASTVRKPASQAPSPIRGLGVVSTEEGAAVVSGAVIRHPMHQHDVVAFLIVEGSEADTMLQSAGTAAFSFEDAAHGGPLTGSVELMRASHVRADWFRRLVGEIFAAVGGTAADVAAHEAKIGIPSTVVAFLRPERVPHTSETGGAVADTAAAPHHDGRRFGHLVLLQGGRSD